MQPKAQIYRTAARIVQAELRACLTEIGDVTELPAAPVNITYFDTFDWRLFNGGISVSTHLTKSVSAIHWSDDNDPAPSLTAPGTISTGTATDFPNGRMRERVSDLIDVRRLVPRLEVQSRRREFTIRDREQKIILRVLMDHYRARHPDGGNAKILGTYLTLAPIRGYAKAAADARTRLAKAIKLEKPPEPLLITGYRALAIELGDYSSKLQITLDPETSAAEAARQIHLTLLDAMVANESGTVEALDPEFLHDFRVAIRRTRSALSQVDKDVLPKEVIDKAKENFRSLGQQTNLMRDLDVYLVNYGSYEKRVPAPYQPFLQPFHDYLTMQQRKERKRVAAMIRSKRYRTVRDNWRTFLEKPPAAKSNLALARVPVKTLANRRIWRAYKRVMKEGRAIDKKSPAEALHAFRITCKKLRYVLEFFQSLYPADAMAALIKSLKSFQNVLGEFQDADVHSQAILQFAKEMEARRSLPVETQMAMGMVAESLLRNKDTARAAFHKRFAAFAQPQTKAAFSQLFKKAE